MRHFWGIYLIYLLKALPIYLMSVITTTAPVIATSSQSIVVLYLICGRDSIFSITVLLLRVVFGMGGVLALELVEYVSGIQRRGIYIGWSALSICNFYHLFSALSPLW